MTTQKEIDAFIAGQPEPKRHDMRALHRMIRAAMPGSRLWLLDGRDETGKVVTNPNVGYGFLTMKLAKGRTRDFYQVGFSANTTGLSVYIMGIADRTYLPRTYGASLGKAKVTGYCINFKALKDIDIDVLEAAIRDCVAQTSGG